VHDLIPSLRRELVAYKLPPSEDRPALTLGQLRAEVNEVSALRHRADLTALGARLPEVLSNLRLASHAYDGSDREQVMGMFAEAYDASRQFTYKLGYSDLASLLADRYEWAAAQSGDRLAVAVGDTMRAAELIGAGEWNGARSIMTASRDSLESDLVGKPDAATLSVYGYLHLEEALATSRAGNAEATWDHLREAEEVASRLGQDRDDYRLAFGPTNVSIWGVALAVELMDGATAVERAQRIHFPASAPRERIGHHFIDLSRGEFMQGNYSDALASLNKARKVAPQQTRYHPMARETVHALAQRERRATESLRSLAAWMGLPD
jgi:tetratricopeptide (TPR) repeat protein